MRKRAHSLLGILIIGGIVLSSNFLADKVISAESHPSQNTIPGCAYSLYGALFYTTGSCPSKGTPTIVSQANGTIPDDSLRSLIYYDKTLYRETVFAGLQCGPCWNYDIIKSCEYDSNGDFVGGIPLRKPFSDDDKAALLDLNSSYSVTICPFKGKSTPTESPTPPNTTVTRGGSFNVMDLGKNTTTNVTKVVPNETSVHQNTNMTGIHYPNTSSNFTSLDNSTKNVSVNSTASNNSNGNLFKKNTSTELGKLSPLKQLESGILVKDVQCKQDLILLVKASNGDPVCVKPTSAARLLAHNWLPIGNFEAKIKS